MMRNLFEGASEAERKVNTYGGNQRNAVERVM